VCAADVDQLSVICLKFQVVVSRDGKEPEPSKNELNQNPGFAKNQTEQNPTL